MLRSVPLEALVWLGGLVVLAAVDAGSIHYTCCPLKNAGWDFCPGCGLGKSISLLFHGFLQQSLQTHPLGIFGVVILSSRIIELMKRYCQQYGKGY